MKLETRRKLLSSVRLCPIAVVWFCFLLDLLVGFVAGTPDYCDGFYWCKLRVIWFLESAPD